MSKPKINIMEHQGLVRSIALKSVHLCTSSVGMDDLQQAGNLGLLRAMQDYDPARGAFSTYATYWIRDAIQTELNNASRTVRLPRSERRRAAKEQRPYPKDGEQLDTIDEPQSTSDDLDYNIDITQQYRAASKIILTKLSPIQQSVIRMRFIQGLDRQDIADRLGYSREGVRKIENQALEILREEMDADNE